MPTATGGGLHSQGGGLTEAGAGRGGAPCCWWGAEQSGGGWLTEAGAGRGGARCHRRGPAQSCIHSFRQAGRQADRGQGGGRQVVNQVHESCRQGVQDWSETYLNT